MPKFAVITGASSGIGAEFARQLSARGYNLLLVARRADRLEKLSDQLTTVCEIFTADLSKKSECLRLVKALEGRRVDLFINNAGFGDCGPFLQTELDKDLDMLSVNIRALHILTKKIGQQLYKQGFGALLNVGSCAGLMPAGPYMATYYATKAYVVSLTSALAQELREARSPVYVGCLCPGPVNTEFNAVANVEFALRGITPEYCVRCALDGMARRKTVIVPNPVVAVGMTLGRFLPRPVYIKIAAHQQRKSCIRDKKCPLSVPDSGILCRGRVLSTPGCVRQPQAFPGGYGIRPDGFSIGGSCRRQATDEGRACHGNPFAANHGNLAPHPASGGASATFPLGGRHFTVRATPHNSRLTA